MPTSLMLYTKKLMHHHAAPFDKRRTDPSPIFEPTETRHHQTSGTPMSPICKAKLLSLA